MAGGSEEFLANLGFDTSDMDKAVQRAITILGHLGNQFDQLSGAAQKAERALSKTGQGVKKSAEGAKQAASWEQELGVQLWHSADAYNRLGAAQKTQIANQKEVAAGQRAAAGREAEILAATKQYSTALGNRISQERALNRETKQRNNRAAESAWNAEFKALSEASRPIDDHVGNLARMRYALYDVSRALAVTGVALTGFAFIAYKTAIDYQRNFANVIRTTGVTGAAIDTLRNQLLAISSTSPISFADVTAIATLAGQLNIAQQSIASFTRVTAQFGATSNVAVTDAATAFGRLDALLPDVQGNYERLADAILNVGVNSVATESQIIAITNRISGIASTVGFTSDQVIGLAGALASVGVQPELSQGTVTRLFSKIQDAAINGGESLEYFAKISGQSAKEFSSAWKADAAQQLITLLDGINEGGPEAIRVIQNLGLTGSRDIPTLLKLAQNTDIYAESLSNAANSAGTLDSQYKIISETVSGRLQVLGNNFQQFLAAVGQGATGIGGLVDQLNSLLRTLTSIVSNPFAAWAVGLGVALTGLAGISALALSAFLRLAASAAAIRTAAGEAAAGTNLLKAAYDLISPSAIRTALLNREVAASNVAVATTAGTAAGATTAQGAAAAGAVGGIARFTSGMKGLGAAIFGIPGLVVAAQLALNGFAAQVGRGVSSGFLDFTGQTPAVDAWGDAIERGNVDLAQLNTTLQITTNGWGQFSNAISSFMGISSPAFQNMQRLDEALSTATPLELANAYERLITQGRELGISAESIAAQLPLATAAYETLGGAAGATELRLTSASEAMEDQVDTLKQSIDAVLEVVSANNQIQSSLYSLGAALGESGDDFSYFSEAGRANLAALSAVIQAYTADAGGNADILAGNLRGLFEAVVAGGYASAGALAILSQAIAATGSAAPATPVDISSLFAGFSSGADKAATSASNLGSQAGKAAKEVRTLVDYANDLGGVFDRALDLRFGKQSALDEIRDKWLDLRDAADETAQKIRELKAEMRALAADKAIKEYWLGVAQNYGDNLRAGELGADIAEIDANIRKNKKETTKEQDKQTKSTKGNSKAAIENRKTLIDLIGDYQDYVEQLAASGASQAEIARAVAQAKRDFEAQAVALGYSKTEVQKYSAAFDDMARIVRSVPRNITVKANTNPALQALAEFVAKVKSTKANISIGGGGGGTRAGTSFGKDWVKGFDAAVSKARIKVIPGGSLKFGKDGQLIEGRVGTLRFYRSGTDWTGSGNPNQIAGYVHNREAVLNERANRMVPSQFINAANQGRNPWQYAPQSPGKIKMPSSMTVTIEPAQFAMLASGRPVQVAFQADDLTKTSSASTTDDSRRGGA